MEKQSAAIRSLFGKSKNDKGPKAQRAKEEAARLAAELQAKEARKKPGDEFKHNRKLDGIHLIIEKLKMSNDVHYHRRKAAQQEREKKKLSLNDHLKQRK